ncbi:MAG: VWA domain-containing protein [Gemmatimonadota bacterium]
MSAGSGWIGLGAVMAALLLRGWSLWRLRNERARLADSGLLRHMLPAPGPIQLALRTALLAAGVGALALTMGGAGASPVERVTTTGFETVLVLDASNSMLARDVAPSRLARQRELARSLAARLPGKIAVVYFAGRGYVLSPLTTDVNAVLMFVDAVRPASVGRGGSALASGLTQALDVLAGGEEDAAGRAMVLFSDGEETVGESAEAALTRARRSHIPVYAVGIGTAEGGTIPLGPDASLALNSRARRRGPGETLLRAPDGEFVVTRLEDDALRQIARTTGGAYFPGATASVEALLRRVSRADAAPSRSGTAPANLFLLLAFGFLWAEAFLFSRG